MHPWRARLARSRVRQLQDPRKPAALCDPAPARHAGVETGSVAKMPLLPQGPLRAGRAHDQADGETGDHAVQVGASDGGAVNCRSACSADLRYQTFTLPLLRHRYRLEVLGSKRWEVDSFAISIESCPRFRCVHWLEPGR
jgi:hypothetical protein